MKVYVVTSVQYSDDEVYFKAVAAGKAFRILKVTSIEEDAKKVAIREYLRAKKEFEYVYGDSCIARYDDEIGLGIVKSSAMGEHDSVTITYHVYDVEKREDEGLSSDFLLRAMVGLTHSK